MQRGSTTKHDDEKTIFPSPGARVVESFTNSTISLTVRWRYVLDRRSNENNNKLASIPTWNEKESPLDSSAVIKTILKTNGTGGEEGEGTSGILNTSLIPPLYCLDGKRLSLNDCTDFNPKSPSLNMRNYTFAYRLYEVFSNPIVLCQETKSLLSTAELRGKQTLDFILGESEHCSIAKKDKEKLHKLFLTEYDMMKKDAEYRRIFDSLPILQDRLYEGQTPEVSLGNTLENLIFLYYYYTRNCFFSLGLEYNTPLDLASKFGLDLDVVKQNCVHFLLVVLHKVNKAISANMGVDYRRNEFADSQSVFIQAVHPNGSIKGKLNKEERNRKTLNQHYSCVKLRGHNQGKTQHQDLVLGVNHLILLKKVWCLPRLYEQDDPYDVFTLEKDEDLPIEKVCCMEEEEALVGHLAPPISVTTTTTHSEEPSTTAATNGGVEIHLQKTRGEHSSNIDSNIATSLREIMEKSLEVVYNKLILKKSFLTLLRTSHFQLNTQTCDDDAATAESQPSKPKTPTSLMIPGGKPEWFLKEKQIDIHFKKHFKKHLVTPSAKKPEENTLGVLEEVESSFTLLGNIPSTLPTTHLVDKAKCSPFLLTRTLQVPYGMGVVENLSVHSERLRSLLKIPSLIPHSFDASLTAISASFKSSISSWLKERVTDAKLMKEIKRLKEVLKKNKNTDVTSVQIRNAQKLACIIHTNALKWVLDDKNNVIGGGRGGIDTKQNLICDLIVQVQPSFKKNLLLTYEKTLLDGLDLKPLVPPAPKKKLSKSPNDDTVGKKIKEKEFSSLFGNYKNKAIKTNRNYSKEEDEDEDDEEDDEEDEDEDEDEDSSAYDEDELDSSMDSISVSDSEDESFDLEKMNRLDDEESMYRITIPQTKQEEREIEARKKERRRQKKEEKRKAKQQQHQQQQQQQQANSSTTHSSTSSNASAASNRVHLRRNVGPVVRYAPTYDDNKDNLQVLKETRSITKKRQEHHRSMREYMASLPRLKDVSVRDKKKIKKQEGLKEKEEEEVVVEEHNGVKKRKRIEEVLTEEGGVVVEEEQEYYHDNGGEESLARKKRQKTVHPIQECEITLDETNKQPSLFHNECEPDKNNFQQARGDTSNRSTKPQVFNFFYTHVIQPKPREAPAHTQKNNLRVLKFTDHTNKNLYISKYPAKQ